MASCGCGYARDVNSQKSVFFTNLYQKNIYFKHDILFFAKKSTAKKQVKKSKQQRLFENRKYFFNKEKNRAELILFERLPCPLAAGLFLINGGHLLFAI